MDSAHIGWAIIWRVWWFYSRLEHAINLDGKAYWLQGEILHTVMNQNWRRLFIIASRRTALMVHFITDGSRKKCVACNDVSIPFSTESFRYFSATCKAKCNKNVALQHSTFFHKQLLLLQRNSARATSAVCRHKIVYAVNVRYEKWKMGQTKSAEIHVIKMMICNHVNGNVVSGAKQ